LHYIAEIISAFDAVALQEIRDDVRGFRRVKELLGEWWEFMVTDVTQGRAGNHERIGFLYDTRKIQFSGLSSQVVLPPDTKQKAARQLARIPFMVSMRAGWFKFVICAVHIYYGAAKADDATRVEEIRSVARYLKERQRDAFAWSDSFLLLGDFNIFQTSDKTFQALTDAGFVIPKQVTKLPSAALNRMEVEPQDAAEEVPGLAHVPPLRPLPDVDRDRHRLQPRLLGEPDAGKGARTAHGPRRLARGLARAAQSSKRSRNCLRTRSSDMRPKAEYGSAPWCIRQAARTGAALWSWRRAPA
jgi:hypothetical protein